MIRFNRKQDKPENKIKTLFQKLLTTFILLQILNTFFIYCLFFLFFFILMLVKIITFSCLIRRCLQYKLIVVNDMVNARKYESTKQENMRAPNELIGKSAELETKV